jgi:hypothetical protein
LSTHLPKYTPKEKKKGDPDLACLHNRYVLTSVHSITHAFGGYVNKWLIRGNGLCPFVASSQVQTNKSENKKYSMKFSKKKKKKKKFKRIHVIKTLKKIIY